MQSTEHYIEQYQAQVGALPGRQVNWLQAQRDAGLARFAQIGFPTQRDEDWRYTTVKPIMAKTFQGLSDSPKLTSQDLKAVQEAIKASEIPELKSHRLVFVDGLFVQKLSTTDAPSEGVTVESLAKVLEESPELIEKAFGSTKPEDAHGFTALNNAYSQDGVVVRLAKKANPSLPVEMLFVSRLENGFAQPRNIIIAENASKAQLIERYISCSGEGESATHTLTNSTTEVVVGEKAEIDYYLVQTQSAAAYHVCGIWARQARDSRFSCRTITLGGALVRNDLGVDLAGENAHCDMLGLYYSKDAQHVDNHTTMRHRVAHCSSREWYKGVLDGRSRAVFHGRIKVDSDAQKTNAAQTNNNLLLSPNAEIDTKPQLEIYADDVKCSHGATVGQINNDALFYLRTRGIDEATAGEMLTFGFINDVVDEIEIDELKQALKDMVIGNLSVGHVPTN